MYLCENCQCIQGLDNLNHIVTTVSSLPTDCRTATALPAATAPPLATAADDIMVAAMELAAMPAAVKPTAPRASGAKAIVPPVEKMYTSCFMESYSFRH